MKRAIVILFILALAIPTIPAMAFAGLQTQLKKILGMFSSIPPGNMT